jgi:hypothetical protein
MANARKGTHRGMDPGGRASRGPPLLSQEWQREHAGRARYCSCVQWVFEFDDDLFPNRGCSRTGFFRTLHELRGRLLSKHRVEWSSSSHC